MMRTALFTAGLLAIAAAGLAARLPRLAQRPMHTDEAVHTVKFEQLWRHGRFVYDLQDYHGPTLYYATLPVMWAAGPADFARTREWHYRLVPVLFGAGLIVLLALTADGLGRGATLAAAALAAISPALLFLSRYYIMETLLVGFTFAAIACGWRYARSGRAGWAVACGAAVGLMQATKETCIIAFAAMAVALVVVRLWSGRATGRAKPPRRLWRPGVLAVAAATAVLTSVLLYSAFFTHWAGPGDSVRAYFSYFRRAGGAGVHEHPWWTYARQLLWFRVADGPVYSEALVVVLAVVGAAAGLAGHGLGAGSKSLARFLAVYAIVLAVAYSAIPYKTPWSILSLLHALVLLAGVGAAVAVRLGRSAATRAAVCAVLAVAAGQLAWQAYRGSYVQFADGRNPCVYAHPSMDMMNLVARVRAVTAVAPRGPDTPVQVIATASDYWPLPWYFRHLTHVGYYDRPPAEAIAPVVVCSTDLIAPLDARIAETHTMTGLFEARYGVFWAVYVQDGLWRRFVQPPAEEAAP